MKSKLVKNVAHAKYWVEVERKPDYWEANMWKDTNKGPVHIYNTVRADSAFRAHTACVNGSDIPAGTTVSVHEVQ